MAKTVIKDKRLEKYIGKTLVVTLKGHPFYHHVCVGKSFNQLPTDSFALQVDYTSGESGFIFSASEVKVLEEKDQALLSNEDIIQQLAGCNYGPRQIAMYLEINEKQFMKLWNDPASAIRFHYEKGRLEADFDVNHKLLETARTGNITAAQIYFKNAELKQVEAVKARIFGGDDDSPNYLDTEIYGEN